MPFDDNGLFYVQTKRRNAKQYREDFDALGKDQTFQRFCELLSDASTVFVIWPAATRAKRDEVNKAFARMHEDGMWQEFCNREYSSLFIIERVKDFLTLSAENSVSLIDPNEKMHRDTLITLKDDMFALISKFCVAAKENPEIREVWAAQLTEHVQTLFYTGNSSKKGKVKRVFDQGAGDEGQSRITCAQGGEDSDA